MSDIGESSKVLSGYKSKKVENISVKNVFVLSLLLGGIGIIAGVMLNSTFISLLIPLLIMGVYIYLTFTKETDLPITVIGDSYYYQGFVFTLIALMASLFSLGVNEKVDMNAMVASFGAALVTTIVGLVARLYVTSFSIESQKRRERLENQIEKSLDRFSGQIDTLTQQVVSSINKVHGKTESTLIETLDKYSEVNSKVMDSFSEAMTSSCGTVESSLKDVSNRISNIEISEDMISKPLSTSLGSIISTLNDYNVTYSNMNQDFTDLSEQLSNQFSNSGSQIEKHVSKLESSMNEAINSQSLIYKDNLNNISEGILTSLGDIKDLKLDTQDSIKLRLEELDGAIKGIVTGLNNSLTPIASTSETLISHGSKISDSIKAITENTDELSKSVKNSLTISESVKDSNTEFSALIENLKKFTLSIESSISSNDQASTKLRDSANATEVASSQVAKDIAEVYKQLSIQVRALRSPS